MPVGLFSVPSRQKQSSAARSSEQHSASSSHLPTAISLFPQAAYLDLAIPKAIQSRALRTIAYDEENENVNRVYLTGSCKDEGTASENKPE